MPWMITDRNLLPEDYYDSYMQTCLERDIRDLIAVSLYRRKSQSGGEPDRYDEKRQTDGCPFWFPHDLYICLRCIQKIPSNTL